MKMSSKQLPLATAIIGVLSLQVAQANDMAQPHVNLEALNAEIDRQGTKVKTNVVTLQEKDESTATDLRGLLQSEPSIDFSGGNGTSSYLTIRGMGQNSVDVKVDNAYSDSQILYHQGRHMLDPSLVKIVSIQKGAGSASAGIGATNGAIVAKTVDAHDLLREGQDIGFKVGAGYSSNDEHSYNAAVYGKAGNFDFLLAGNRVDQDNFKAGGNWKDDKGNDKVLYQALDKVSYLAKVGATFGDHRFVLSHMKQENKGTRNIREEFLDFNGQDPQYRKLSLEQTNLEWVGKNLIHNTDITANIYTMENKRISADDTISGYAGNLKGNNKTYVETKGANINFDSQVHDDVLLKYGVNYRHQETTPNRRLTATDLVGNTGIPLGVNVVNQEKTDVGVYVEAIGNIGNVTATAGIRYDHFKFKAMDGKEVSNDDLNPSIGLIWQATPTLSFNANHNYATRSPRMYDALTAHGARSIVSIVDGTKAEKAQNTEIGFNYNNGDFSLNGGYFWQDIDNLLHSGAGRHGTGLNQAPIRNAGYAKNRGYEVNASYKYQGLTARLGVSDSDPQFYSIPVGASNRLLSFANRDFASRLGRTWTAGLAYRFANPNVEIGANHRLVEDTVGQSAWTTHTITGSNSDNDTNMKRKGYNVTDIYANWKPYGNDRMNVNFAVNNVGDELYTPHVSSSARAVPAAGREYRVGINFTY